MSLKLDTEYLEPTFSKDRNLGRIFFALLFTTVLVSPLILHLTLGLSAAPVLTGSMRPINPGDMMIMKNTLASQLKVGDVVALTNPKTEVRFAHRLVTVVKQSGTIRVTTKGDANSSIDSDILVLGLDAKFPRMVGHVKYIGRVIVFLTSKSAALLGVIALILAMVFTLIEFALSGKARNRREKELNEREIALNAREEKLNNQ